MSILGTLSSTAINTGSIAATTIGLTGELDFNGDSHKFIDFQTLNNKNVEFRHFDGGSTYEMFLKSSANGNVEAYFNGLKKLETTSVGITVTGNIDLGDNFSLNLGASQDLQIFHDGTNSYLKEAGTGNVIHEVTDATIEFKKGGSEHLAKFIPDGAVELYYDNSKKFETTSTGSQFQGTLFGADNTIITLGSSNDFRLYHNGSNSYIDNGLTGTPLVFKANVYSFRNAADTEQVAYFQAGDRVELHYANAIKLRTESYGIQVFGTLYSNVIQLTSELDFVGFSTKIIDFGTVSGGSTSSFTFRHTDHSSFFENALDSFPNGATRLAFDGTVKVESASYGTLTQGTSIIAGSSTDEKIPLGFFSFSEA